MRSPSFGLLSIFPRRTRAPGALWLWYTNIRSRRRGVRTHAQSSQHLYRYATVAAGAPQHRCAQSMGARVLAHRRYYCQQTPKTPCGPRWTSTALDLCTQHLERARVQTPIEHLQLHERKCSWAWHLPDYADDLQDLPQEFVIYRKAG